MPGIASDLRVYAKYIKMHFLCGLEYKGWWMMALQVVINVLLDILGTVFLFLRFGNVGEWTLARIVLVYAMAVSSFGLAETFCRGFDYFPWRMIRSGDFDRLLLRPRSLFTQVAGSYFHIHRMARALGGMVLMAWALGDMGIPITPWVVGVLALSLLGGLACYSGVFVLTSGIAFFTVQALDWIYLFSNASYQVTRIPVPYMPRLLRHVFTFVMPMLVISYYPASLICGWGEPAITGYLALPAGLLFLGVSLLVWRVGVAHYQSTGS